MVIDDEGENLGVLDTQDAIERAQAKTLDLVEVSPMADPPVCRFMDYGKYAFERQKQVQAQRKNARKTQIKEIKFRPGTDIGDYNTKIRKLGEFLEAGDKTKVTIRFRGREMAHQDLGLELLRRVEGDLVELATVEQHPKSEGRQMMMVLAPKKK